MSNVQGALAKLASYRAKNTRESRQTFETGLLVLKSGKTSGLGDEEWSFYEQLILSALDIGRIDVADQCLTKLSVKFPESPRVDVLNGIRMEATESPEKVLAYYDHLMKIDPANVSAWRRRVSVLRRLGRLDKAVEELNELLDTVYTDSEGWLELADMYSLCNQYPSALQALSHALLLSPQNPFTFLQFAETAYTSGDLPLALKMYLVVIEMNDSEDADAIPLGISVRAWWGAKLCTRQLVLSSSYHGSPSNTPVPKNLALLDELATERVLTAYSGEKGVQTRSLVSGWMSGR
ncbi:tetratricopeptide repeat domain 35 [Crepidotus variabilis]|uniref:ER membrane protein complex subunit 2 n=1 Tax=Crepidotus variabilis TaxID=179855 RepID=A0A9P6EJ35_9AGAR|nr:tetratricopeptide repeat domain 35 [Crepidotus variabilis]